MDRELSDREIAVLNWVLDGDESYRSQIPELRVLGGCGCGCPSIDFVRPGARLGFPLDREGWVRDLPVQITVFALDGKITGLELTDFAGLTTELPDPGELVDHPPQ